MDGRSLKSLNRSIPLLTSLGIAVVSYAVTLVILTGCAYSLGPKARQLHCERHH